MAVLQALLTFITRSAGKLLNTAFGWASRMLFGKAPDNRQTYLSEINFASVIWMVVLVGVLFPRAGVFLLSFIPLPQWVNAGWIRLAMLAAALLLPLLIGFLSVRMLDPAQRPSSTAEKAKGIIKGYPYMLGLALTLILMTLLAPIVKVRDVLRPWSTQHFPIIVEPADYRPLLQDIELALGRLGMPTEHCKAIGRVGITDRTVHVAPAQPSRESIAATSRGKRGRARHRHQPPSLPGPPTEPEPVRRV